MSTPLVVLVTVAYLVTAVEQFIHKNYPVGLMFTGYTLANLGVMSILK